MKRLVLLFLLGLAGVAICAGADADAAKRPTSSSTSPNPYVGTYTFIILPSTYTSLTSQPPIVGAFNVNVGAAGVLSGKGLLWHTNIVLRISGGINSIGHGTFTVYRQPNAIYQKWIISSYAIGSAGISNVQNGKYIVFAPVSDTFPVAGSYHGTMSNGARLEAVVFPDGEGQALLLGYYKLGYRAARFSGEVTPTSFLAYIAQYRVTLVGKFLANSKITGYYKVTNQTKVGTFGMNKQ
jgi:hypothetical protein